MTFLVWPSRSPSPGSGVTAPLPARRLTTWQGFDGTPAFAPDGRTLAFASDRSGALEIYVIGLAAGSQPVAITHSGGQNEQPTWSPDGQWIAFQSNRKNRRWQVYRMRADGTDLLQLTFDAENKEPDWSKKPE